MTTEEGLVVEMVEYAGPDGEMLPGYLARPGRGWAVPGRDRAAGVVGYRRACQGHPRRVAQAGYVALAPDLYKGQVATEPDERASWSWSWTCRRRCRKSERGRLFAGP